jgi:hypothetical protein
VNLKPSSILRTKALQLFRAQALLIETLLIPRVPVLRQKEFKMSWNDDPIFVGDPSDPQRISEFARPAFRLSILSSFDQAHPLAHTEAWQDLFDCFAPSLKTHCDRLLMIDKPGGKPRRRKTLTDIDWQPFHHLKSCVPTDDGHWIGFRFQSGYKNEDGYMDCGPALFNFWVGSIVQADICIPVADFASLDISRVIEALGRLPFGTAVGGYGLALAEVVHNGSSMDEFAKKLIPVAQKYPCLDVCHNGFRYWYADYEGDLSTYWLAGINWLTGVGEPFLSALGGSKSLLANLPSEVRAFEGPSNIVFQIGDQPLTGQPEAESILLPSFYKLGKKLSPRPGGWPSSKKTPGLLFGEDHEKLAVAWFRRFYDGPDGSWWR